MWPGATGGVGGGWRADKGGWVLVGQAGSEKTDCGFIVCTLIYWEYFDKQIFPFSSCKKEQNKRRKGKKWLTNVHQLCFKRTGGKTKLCKNNFLLLYEIKTIYLLHTTFESMVVGLLTKMKKSPIQASLSIAIIPFKSLLPTFLKCCVHETINNHNDN